jgi:hypothetical protein
MLPPHLFSPTSRTPAPNSFRSGTSVPLLGCAARGHPGTGQPGPLRHIRRQTGGAGDASRVPSRPLALKPASRCLRTTGRSAAASAHGNSSGLLWRNPGPILSPIEPAVAGAAKAASFNGNVSEMTATTSTPIPSVPLRRHLGYIANTFRVICMSLRESPSQ